MEYILAGYRDVEFDSKDGKHISGFTLYLLGKKKGVNGYVAFKKWLSRDLVDESGVDMAQALNNPVLLFCDTDGNPVRLELPEF